MKKGNEGYALAFVMAILLVLSLCAASLLTVSLRNLERQQNAIDRLESSYTVPEVEP